MTTSAGIDQMVAQLRALAVQAEQPLAAANPSASGQTGVDFAALLEHALAQTHAAQSQARELARQFASGEPGAALEEVVLSLQKASVSFQTMVQVRNKLVSAYQEIMNMQV
ncbi:MAG: flagellar hook-basal body complex protein FliE [Thiobacillaceae bacterium]|nr:flagellar hook-basal body complex protein FliE [Thiobacillaceae bacterium]MCX7672554.1 flagellar hook-basal body complex protein FliE [Thiobacillaceae bacterium]MDW8322496.1 flagellar hook-basal body complex protein FliE [Burkholderiales bacterium]